jgi:hypothetical protein
LALFDLRSVFSVISSCSTFAPLSAKSGEAHFSEATELILRQAQDDGFGKKGFSQRSLSGLAGFL